MKRLLICVAINEEYKVVKKFLQNGMIDGVPVDVVMTSMGMKAAAKAAQEALNPNLHGGVLVLGYCGGLVSSLKVGDAVVATSSFSDDKLTFNVDKVIVDKMCRSLKEADLNSFSVPLVTVPLVVETPEDKKKLFTICGAQAVDMETSEIIQAAVDKNIRFGAMKIVIDDVETELPEFNEHFKKTGKMDHLSVASVLVKSPALSSNLAQNMKRGAEVLQRALPGLVKALARHWKIVE